MFVLVGAVVMDGVANVIAETLHEGQNAVGALQGGDGVGATETLHVLCARVCESG